MNDKYVPRDRQAAMQGLLEFLRNGCLVDATPRWIRAEDGSGNSYTFHTGGDVMEADLELLVRDETDKWMLYPAVLESRYLARGFKHRAIIEVLNRLDIEELVLAVAHASFDDVVEMLEPLVQETTASLREASLRWEAEKARPTFKDDRLWVGPALVKRFSKPAPNQRIILDSFQELGWPDSIDDPIPPEPEVVSQRRLRDTVDAPNDHHATKHVIRFGTAGGNTKIKWRHGGR